METEDKCKRISRRYRNENLYIVISDKGLNLSTANNGQQLTQSSLSLIADLITTMLEDGHSREELAKICFRSSLDVKHDLPGILSEELVR